MADKVSFTNNAAKKIVPAEPRVPAIFGPGNEPFTDAESSPKRERPEGVSTLPELIRFIIDRSGYRGYLPFEALGPGDPTPRVIAFLEKIRRAFAL